MERRGIGDMEELRDLARKRDRKAEDMRATMLAGVAAEYEAMRSVGAAKWVGDVLFRNITHNWRP